MKKDAKIYIAGYKGLVGSAIKRKLEEKQYSNLIFSDIGDFNLQRQEEVERFFEREKP
ncbi:MAG: GDP-L-fucose synthase, partial [bacterium]|nr:GDP-L-fucose synthase [bacterium]